MNVSFSINDDNVALEDLESYPLRLGTTSPSDGVTTGAPTNVRISDDDRKLNMYNISIFYASPF